jgi:hypothetical protein
MKNILDQIENLPDEFVVEMEQQKNDRWNDVYDFVIKQFDCEKELTEIELQGFKINNFLKCFHDLGFYGGVNFALDPQEPYTNNK